MFGRSFLRLGLVTLSILSGIVGCEVLARLVVWWDDREIISDALLNPLPAPKVTWAGSWHVIRLNPNPKIIYELKPNLKVNFMGGLMTTNSNGLRGPERALEHPPNTIRVVCLGDSVGMGWRLHDGDELMALAEHFLNQRSQSPRWEFINTSVLGYNSVQEVETLKSKGLQYHPDIVIVNYVVNDIELPSFIRQGRNYFSLSNSFLLEVCKDRLGLQQRASGLMVVDHNSVGNSELLTNPKLVPPAYSSMVGWSAFSNAMEELAELSRLHHFEVVFVCYPDYSDQAAAIAERLGFRVVNTAPALQEYMKKKGIPRWQPPMCLDMPDGSVDPHPSKLSNLLVLKIVMDALESQAAKQNFRLVRRKRPRTGERSSQVFRSPGSTTLVQGRMG